MRFKNLSEVKQYIVSHLGEHTLEDALYHIRKFIRRKARSLSPAERQAIKDNHKILWLLLAHWFVDYRESRNRVNIIMVVPAGQITQVRAKA